MKILQAEDPTLPVRMWPRQFDLDPSTVIFVKTDSRGEAKVYLRLGKSLDGSADNTAINHEVTATTPNGTPSAGIEFIATARRVESGDAITIAIDSGNGQSAGTDEPLDDPLVVVVRRCQWADSCRSTCHLHHKQRCVSTA